MIATQTIQGLAMASMYLILAVPPAILSAAYIGVLPGVLGRSCEEPVMRFVMGAFSSVLPVFIATQLPRLNPGINVPYAIIGAICLGFMATVIVGDVRGLIKRVDSIAGADEPVGGYDDFEMAMNATANASAVAHGDETDPADAFVE